MVFWGRTRIPQRFWHCSKPAGNPPANLIPQSVIQRYRRAEPRGASPLSSSWGAATGVSRRGSLSALRSCAAGWMCSWCSLGCRPRRARSHHACRASSNVPFLPWPEPPPPWGSSCRDSHLWWCRCAVLSLTCLFFHLLNRWHASWAGTYVSPIFISIIQ